MNRYIAFFLFFVGCGKIDRSMEAELTVLEPLVLKEEGSGVLETIPAGEHSVILTLESGKSSEEPGRIVLNVAEQRFVFEISHKKLSRLVFEEQAVEKMTSEDLGQPYDLELKHERKVRRKPVKDENSLCFYWEQSETEEHEYYDKIIDDYYDIVFLEQGVLEGAGVARLKVSEQEVVRVDKEAPCLGIMLDR